MSTEPETPKPGDAQLEVKAERRLLEQLASGDNAELREIAKQLMSGRLTTQEIATIPQYQDAVAQAGQPFWKWYDSASEQEREAFAEQGRRELDRLAEEPEPKPARRRAAEPEADYSDAVYIQDALGRDTSGPRWSG